MRNICLSLFLTIFCFSAFAQQYSISGRVKNIEDGEDLIGAIVKLESGGGAYTNQYGFYSITVSKGQHKVTYSYFGYQDQTLEFNVTKDTVINIELVPEADEIEAVTVSAEKEDSKVENKEISVVKMEMKDIKEIPVIFGEVDVLKTITLLPGIQSGGEGSTGINVRGGGQDQNLIILDEATVYNASHLLGFFSVFNGDAIKGLEVYKGGIPAKYGGRLASLIDIRMKDGNSKQFAGAGGVGTISSRLTLEGPIIKDKSSFMIAGRRSYADLFLPFAPDETVQQSTLYFYDLNLKSNYKISDNDRLYLSGYFGRDVFGLGNLFGLAWGNATATLRWNHIFNQKLFANFSLVYSDFDYGFSIDFDENTNIAFDQNITDYYGKADFIYYANTKSTFTYGGQLIYHDFNPGTFTALEDVQQLDKRKAFESAIYIDHNYEIDARFNIRYGLRYSAFANMGGTLYEYVKDENGQPISDLTQETEYDNAQISNYFGGLEPRASVSYNLNTLTALKSTYNRTIQYIQQASNTASAFPTDQWFSSNNNVKPQIADQVALGLFKNFKKNFETSVEVYYKWMQNQIDYREGANLFFNDQLDGELLFGKGWSYGAEFFINKTSGTTTGFISYTWSKSMRQVDGINFNDPYPTNFDRRHNLSVVVSQKLGTRFVLSGTFVYNSGNPFSPPVGKYFYQDGWNNIYGSRNNYRIPDYHRMDLGLTLKPKESEKRFKSSWNLSVYNVYNRENPYAIYFPEANAEQAEKFGVKEGDTIAVQVALFKIIPSLTWNFEF
ncbi:TonB-dependent receptor [bacterium]|nr:TonB-dependent receptor [bacterium]